MAFIEVENLKYRYPHGRALALKGLNFTLEKGSCLGIIGENKAGKSTLCQAMAGLVPTLFKGAYGGHVRVGGMEVAAEPVARVCEKVGLVFQNPFNQLTGARETVYEEVAFGLQNLGVAPEEIHERVTRCLDQLGLGPYQDRNPFSLSGGQTQRVALAGILAMEPELLVLDEPASQLDPEGRRDIYAIIRQLQNTGITVMIVDNQIEALAEICDHLLLLYQGEQMAFGAPAKLFQEVDTAAYGISPPLYTRLAMGTGENTGEGLPVTEKAFLEKQWLPHSLQAPSDADRKTSMKKEVVHIRNLAFAYPGENSLFQEMNLTLDGRPTAFLGQNGAGKTTLMKLIRGLLKPAQGEILLEGENMLPVPLWKSAGRLGYVFQNPDDQIFKHRVLDEVMMGPLQQNNARREAERISLEALESLEIAHLAGENPYDLDLAERKMVALASVLAMHPRVLLLDEPTIGQDEKGCSILGNRILQCVEAGQQVAAVLHDMDFTARYFERIIVLGEGKILADGSPREVFGRKTVLEQGGLQAPAVTKLCEKLGYKGVFLTPEEVEKAGGKVDGRGSPQKKAASDFKER